MLLSKKHAERQQYLLKTTVKIDIKEKKVGGKNVHSVVNSPPLVIEICWRGWTDS